MTHKAENVYYVAFCRISLLSPDLPKLCEGGDHICVRTQYPRMSLTQMFSENSNNCLSQLFFSPNAQAGVLTLQSVFFLRGPGRTLLISTPSVWLQSGHLGGSALKPMMAREEPQGSN